MLVKVCGITNVETAKVVEAAGANFIGFLFAPSKRRISPEKAHDIAKQLSPELKKVGVFVNESYENIIHIAKTVGLDYVQLHGDEDADFARQLPFPVIKAFSVGQADPKVIETFPADFLLLDSPGKKYRGGSGETFNWDKIKELDLGHQKVILAGGLNAENVQDAIAAVSPHGIDVSSGVETDGEKDPEKIKVFLQRARQAIEKA